MGAFVQLILMSYLGVAQTGETVRFTAWNELANPSKEILQLKNAVHRIESENGSCSATTISSAGHILTARHCMVICLLKSGAFIKKVEEGYDYYETTKDSLKSAQCNIKIDGQPVTVQIEVTSPGFIFGFNEKGFEILSPVKFKDFVANGYTGNGDFVIFKPIGLTQPAPCVGLSKRSVQPGDIQQTLGFPSETTRPDGHNSNGSDLYYSKGTVIGDISQNSCFGSVPPTPYNLDGMKQTFNNPTGFMSTLDAIYGSSGTGVVDSDNHISGILTNVFRLAEYTKLDSDEPGNRFCEGSARTLSTDTIRHFLSEQGYDLSALSCAQ